jgi:TonB family protein
VAALEPTVQRIGALVDGATVLSLDVMIPTHGVWDHRLLRRAFSIGEIQGALDLMEIRCARRNVRYEEVAADLTWQIPPSWGACSVYVKGTAGATFKLYELPVEGGATTQAPGTPPVQSSSENVAPGIASGQDRDVVPLVRIAPEYPSRALRQKQCGWVRLAFDITEIGTVEDARVVEASDTVFGPAAVAALARWRYNPKIEDGMRVRREGMQTTIRFALQDGKGPDCRY